MNNETLSADTAVPAPARAGVPGAMPEAGSPVLELEAVQRRFGGTRALDGATLRLGHGELLAVVGPSGCGKSTMLRAIAGLTPVDAGAISIAGDLVAGRGAWVPPEQRRVGVVFQDHALFPHLDVAENVAFGLAGSTRRERRRRHDAGRRARVTEVLELVGLAGFGTRYPHELSGGEQQRVALARALAPSPHVVLLDEPFSNLDHNLRTRVRDLTVDLLRNAGASAMFVTHDQEEALVIGDRVAVLHAGVIEQADRPEAVFHTPSSRFVATFMGEADFVPGRQDGTVVTTAFGQYPATDEGQGPVEVMLRPHDVDFAADDNGNAIVTRTEFRGATVLHHLRLQDGSTVRALRPHDRPVPVRTRVAVIPRPGHPLAAFPA